MEPDTLNLDPDPEFWPNLDPDQGYVINFETKIIKNNVRNKTHVLQINGLVKTISF